MHFFCMKKLLVNRVQPLNERVSIVTYFILLPGEQATQPPRFICGRLEQHGWEITF